MTKAARYIVLIDRQLGESDGSSIYHDGTGQAAATQLAKELQEAWDSGGVDGFFEVVSRQVISWPADTEGLFTHVPRHFEDEDELAYTDADPTDAHYAGRIRVLGAMLADVMGELPAGEAAIALDTALDSIDSAIRTLESEDDD